MFKGITFVLIACFFWGFIFVIPQFMKGFSPLEVALGRYLFYGIISALIFFRLYCKNQCHYPLAAWRKAIYFSLITSFGYYPFVVFALRYSTPAICTLILGVSPIAIAFYGNWKQKECSFRSLIIPSLLILLGLIFINVPELIQSASPSNYLLGILCSFFALGMWSWYVVMNAQFLKKNPDLKGSDWATLIGVFTLFWTVIVTLFLSFFFKDHLDIAKFGSLNFALLKFLLGSAFLGFFCSWVGGYLWNKASLALPISLAGQLTIFETIFGLSFIFLLNLQRPSLLEGIGIGFFLSALLYGVRQFKNTPH